jgi:hypothetical protein
LTALGACFVLPIEKVGEENAKPQKQGIKTAEWEPGEFNEPGASAQVSPFEKSIKKRKVHFMITKT